MAPSSFIAKTFYEDIHTRELLYAVGRDSKRVVFDASVGQRIMDEKTFLEQIVPVNPADPNYCFNSVRSSDLFRRVQAEEARITQSHLLPEGPMLDELRSEFTYNNTLQALESAERAGVAQSQPKCTTRERVEQALFESRSGLARDIVLERERTGKQ